MMIGMVDITAVKAVATKLPQGHPLRAVMEVEPQIMPAEEFVTKVVTWLKLAEAVPLR